MGTQGRRPRKNLRPQTFPRYGKANPSLMREFHGNPTGSYDGYLNSLFPGVNRLGVERRLVLSRIKARENSGEPHQYIEVFDNHRTRLTLFYTAQKDTWFFVKHEKYSGEVWVSISYRTKERALDVAKVRQITFIEKVNVPPTLN